MKKRYLIPSLLLLSSVALTACNGEGGGLVKGGQKYRAGDAQNVSPALRAEKEGSVKTVTENINMSVSMKMSASGRSLSVSEKLSGSIKVDLVNHTLDGNFTVSASVSGAGSQTTKATFRANEQNGVITIQNGSNYESSYDEESLATLYEEASYTIYSWNYEPSEGQIGQLTEALSSLSEVTSADTIMKEISKMYSNIYIAGEVETGTFDIGLAEGYTLNIIAGLPITFNKMKSSYKEGLVRSSVVGLTMKGKVDGMSMNITETMTVNYSYETSAAK